MNQLETFREGMLGADDDQCVKERAIAREDVFARQSGGKQQADAGVQGKTSESLVHSVQGAGGRKLLCERNRARLLLCPKVRLCYDRFK